MLNLARSVLRPHKATMLTLHPIALERPVSVQCRCKDSRIENLGAIFFVWVLVECGVHVRIRRTRHRFRFGLYLYDSSKGGVSCIQGIEYATKHELRFSESTNVVVR